MLRESSYIELELEPGEALSLTRSTGWELLCVSGRIWLTEQGGGDVWLGAGEARRLSLPGRTVIEAARDGASLKLRQAEKSVSATRRRGVPGHAPPPLALPRSPLQLA